MTIKQYLREKQQAGIISISPRTLRDWRRLKIIPFFKIGRIIFYDPQKVEEAIAKFERKAATK